MRIINSKETREYFTSVFDTFMHVNPIGFISFFSFLGKV